MVELRVYNTVYVNQSVQTWPMRRTVCVVQCHCALLHHRVAVTFDAEFPRFLNPGSAELISNIKYQQASGPIKMVLSRLFSAKTPCSLEYSLFYVVMGKQALMEH